MTRVFVFKGKVFCGVFNVFNDLEQWKTSFCLNNGFEKNDIKIAILSVEDMEKYDIILKSPNVSRVVFEDEIQIIGTHLVDDKEVIVDKFIPATLI